jgi:hypothetical protein
LCAQIYGDKLKSEQTGRQQNKTAPDTGRPLGPPLSYGQMVERYREMYRGTWEVPAMQRMLRSGAHWMLPDDHDMYGRRRC